MIKAMKLLSGLMIGLVLIGSMTGCSKFLSDPELRKDPNRAVKVSTDQLFNGVQVATFFSQEGQDCRSIAIWMQQTCGTDRQFVGIAHYDLLEDNVSEAYENLYDFGGLGDIKTLLQETTAKDWIAYRGIVKFYEALRMGMGASLWGDISFSEACTDVATPKLDAQADVYAAVQAILDEAIADLQSGKDSYLPPNDMVFAGDLNSWVKACYSLKARYYMHWAEGDAANYGRALSAAQNGISSVAGNYVTIHADALNEGNMWSQFEKQRAGYQRAGKFMVELLKARKDPRLEIYFAKDDKDGYSGSSPDNPDVAVSNIGDAFLDPAHSTDVLTWEETQLIIAECAYKTGDQATALAKLNETRRGIEQRWGFSADTLGVAAGLTGEALLNAVLEEKFIALFLNMETYNDWKRTNKPDLATFQGKAIPRRFYYSNNERTTNPNIPVPAQQPSRNANDPGDAY
jgi:hypothetical protein